jgi:hypothetical protein
MLLTPDTCNSQAGTAAREYVLRYPGQHHPDENVFQRLEQRQRKTRKCNTMTRISAGHSCTERTPANEDTIIAAVE